MVSLVHSRLDYGNFVLVGLPVYLQRRLQSVLNAVARLVFRLRCYDHVTDAFATLHWLRLPQGVDFTAFRVLNGFAPPYLNQLVRVADLLSRRRLRSASAHQLLVPSFRLTTVGRVVDGHFQSLLHFFGTQKSKHLLCLPSINVLKHFFFASLFLTLFFDHTTPSWSMK